MLCLCLLLLNIADGVYDVVIFFLDGLEPGLVKLNNMIIKKSIGICNNTTTTIINIMKSFKHEKKINNFRK